MRVRPLILAVLVVTAACESGGDDGVAGALTTTVPSSLPSTTMAEEPPPGWAMPITAYVDALFTAANEGDLAGLFLSFNENTVLWLDTTSSEVRAFGGGAQDLLRRLEAITVAERPVRGRPLLFVSWIPPEVGPQWIGSEFDRPGFWVLAPHLADYGETTLVELVAIAGRGDEIFELTRAPLVADVRRDPFDRVETAALAEIGPVLDRVESDYVELAAAMNEQDVARILGTEDGMEPDPGDVAAVEVLAAALPELFAVWPDARWESLAPAEIGLGDATDPAVFVVTDPDPSDFQDEIGGYGIYRLELEPGLSGLAMAHWMRRSGVLAGLDVALAVWFADAIDGPEMPAGPEHWPQVPQRGRRPTGTIATGSGAAVELYNAEPAQHDLVAWAVRRFEEAGLGAPTPRSVTFPPDLRCVEVSGQAVHTEWGVDLLLCMEAADVCTGDGCEPSVASRATLLHELGHVWNAENLDEATRARFMDFRKLGVWSDPATERDVLGTEHAAEILSWGLMDESTWGARLPDAACEVLSAGFEILTGRAPLRVCPG